MKYPFFTVAILLLISFSAHSQSSVWKVEGNGTEFYIGGSIHILRAKDYPLPDEFYEAYNKCDILTTEMDINDANSAQNILKMQQSLIFQDDKTLSSVLNKEVYNKLDSVCKVMDMDIKLMDKLKPSMISMMLTLQSLRKLDVTERGVDSYFTGKAISDEKTLLFLETFDEQLSFIESMGAGNENEFILYTIKDIENNENEFVDLIEYWKRGEQELMLKQLQDYKQNYPDIYKTVVVDRNNAWMTHLMNYLKTTEIEFVIVGAMHLVGPQGLINQLKQKGFKVSQL